MRWVAGLIADVARKSERDRVLGIAGENAFMAVLTIFPILIVVAAALLFVEPRPGIAQHAEIMVGELQIIFGLDAVAGKLGVTRHALIFLV